MVSIGPAHARPSGLDPAKFDPDRFIGAPAGQPHLDSRPAAELRRCIGAAFANMELNVTLRTLLEQFTFVPTSAPGES